MKKYNFTNRGREEDEDGMYIKHKDVDELICAVRCYVGNLGKPREELFRFSIMEKHYSKLYETMKKFDKE